MLRVAVVYLPVNCRRPEPGRPGLHQEILRHVEDVRAGGVFM
ncbi:MAG: hypothetical protein ACRDUB_14955 [Mycobacterium sp.]